MYGCSMSFRALELCESRGGRPGLPVPNSPYGLCERKAASDLSDVIVIELKVLHFWLCRMTCSSLKKLKYVS